MEGRSTTTQQFSIHKKLQQDLKNAEDLNLSYEYHCEVLEGRVRNLKAIINNFIANTTNLGPNVTKLSEEFKNYSEKEKIYRGCNPDYCFPPCPPGDFIQRKEQERAKLDQKRKGNPYKEGSASKPKDGPSSN